MQPPPSSFFSPSSPTFITHLPFTLLLTIIYILLHIFVQPVNAYYISATFTPTSTVINQYTSYTIVLQRNSDPVNNNFISPVSTVPSTAYIQIKFPSQYNFPSPYPTLTCTIAQIATPCSLSPSTLTLTLASPFSSSSTQSASILTLSVSQIKNPQKASASSNFEYFIKHANGTIIDQSPSPTSDVYSTSIQFSPALFTTCTVSGNGNYVQTRSKMTVKMGVRNALPANGVFVIDVPLIWSGDYQGTTTVSSMPNCNGISGVSGVSCNYTLLDPPLSLVRITVSGLGSGVPTGTQVQLDISSILTPPYVNSVEQIAISSQYQDGTKIDTCSTAVTNTIPIPFRAISFAISSGTSEVQTVFSGKLTVTLARIFSYLDQVYIQVPKNFLTSNQISITCSNYARFVTTVQSSSTNSLTSTIILSDFPSSPQKIASNSLFIIIFNNITNYISTEPQIITITFKRYGQNYQQSSATSTASIGTVTSFSLTSSNLTVNGKGTATISITSQYKIPASSIIQIILPSSVIASDVSSSPVSYCYVQSSTSSSCTYTLLSNKITISNIFTAPFSLNLIQLKIPNFPNPPTVRPTSYVLQISSPSFYSSNSSIFYPIAQSTSTFTASPQILKQNPIVTLSSYQVMKQQVVISVNFQTYYPYTSVSVIVPSGIGVGVGTGGTGNNCAPNSFSSCGVTDMGDGRMNVTFIGNQLGGLLTLSWDGNTNPNSFKPTSSFQLYTYSSSYMVQKSSNFTSLVMTQQTSFLSAQAIPSSYTNNDLISIQINYTMPQRSPTGTITITVPVGLDLTTASCSSACSIIISSFAILVPFTASATVPSSPISQSLILNNVRNSPSFKPLSQFTISLKTLQNYQSLISTFPAWTNVAASTFSTTVSSNLAYLGQNALFTFQLSGMPGTQTYLNITMNQNFRSLSAAPSPNSIFMSSYIFRFQIPGQSSTTLSATLETPISRGNYTFSLEIFTNDGYLMGKSVSNIWMHSCDGTQCRACNGDGTCVDCYNSNLTNFYIYNTATKNCVRACEVSFYLDNVTNNCIPCSSNCLQCVQSSTKCTSCPIINSIVYYLNPLFNTCVTQCPRTYYPNPNPQKCLPCIGTCFTCLDSTTCLSCIQNFFLLNTTRTCISTCPTLITVPDSLTRTCLACIPSCLTCSILPYNCTSCNNSLSLYLQPFSCVSQCLPQFYLKSFSPSTELICSACQLPCKVCHNQTTFCSSCWPNSTQFLWFNYKCIPKQQCQIKHFINFVNGSCDACAYQCSLCTAINLCTECIQGYFLEGAKCVLECSNGKYGDDQIRECLDCVGCLTCANATYCYSCVGAQFLYLGVCYGVCPDGSYRNSQTVSGVTRKVCTVCPIECPTCQNATYCLSCLPQQYLYKGVCSSNCPISTYPSSPICLDCPPTCLTCSSSSICLTCRTNYSLQKDKCVLNCQLGISIDQVCYPCGLHCADCNVTICQSCQQSFFLQNGACVAACSIDTTAMNGNQCRPCKEKYVNCSTCSAAQCLSCFDGELVNGACLPCAPGFYTHNSKCVTCPSQCTLCANQTYCTSCAVNFYLEANFCVATCPNNKIPNGTKCDVCVQNCAQCNLQTQGCLICLAGLFQFQGKCLQSCPDPYVINLNKTLCITKDEFSQQYSLASKPIYFPFSIASILLILLSIPLKCHIPKIHLVTLLVSVLFYVQIASWLLFAIIEYLFYSNQQAKALYGIILVIAGVGMGVICNIIFGIFYCKYFKNDAEFQKWVRRHWCVNGFFVILGVVIGFRGHRMVYSRFLDRDQLSMVLSSIRKLTPINVLSIVSVFVTSGPIIAGTALAIYNSLNQDQQFFNALDTFIVTCLVVLLLLLDLRHGNNYFIDQLESQNIKNKMFYEDYQQFSINEKKEKGEKYRIQDQHASNISNQNLIEAGVDSSGNILDQMATAKKFRTGKNMKVEKIEENEANETLRQGGTFANKRKKVSGIQGDSLSVPEGNSQTRLQKSSQQQQEYNQTLEQPSEDILAEPQKPQWLPKQYSPHGYLIKPNPLTNQPILYNKDGYQVKINEDTGEHELYNDDGYRMRWNEEKGKYQRFGADGYLVGDDGSRYDKRGYRVEGEKGNEKFYDENGYQVLQKDGKEVKIDSKGNRVQIDPNTKQPKFFTPQGYQIIYSKTPSPDVLLDPETGLHVRLNPKSKKFQFYDPKDKLQLIYNEQTGKYQKFDEFGFRVQYDEYGNLYRYDQDGYRVVIGAGGQVRRYDVDGYEVRKEDGQIRKYDKDGYLVKIDPRTGQKVFYDQHGYRVQRDFYGKPTLYNSDGNMVIIDPQSDKHRVFNPQGLEIISDGKGGTYLRDKRGRKVVELEDGYYQKYDQIGNKIWLDQDGYQVQNDEDGNAVRYDKVGDRVLDSEEDEEMKEEGDGDFFMDQGQGDSHMPVHSKNKQIKQKKSPKKFKLQKQYNFQQQYSKMLSQTTPHVFNFQSESQPDNLKQFHDVQPPTQYELEKEYQTLYNLQAQNDHMKRQDSQQNFFKNNYNLENLAQIDNTPYKNLKQRVRRRQKTGDLNGNHSGLEDSEKNIQEEEKQDPIEIKSVADVSIQERSFDNEGVQPLTDQSRNQDEDMESIEQIETGGVNMAKNKGKRRSQANFKKNDKKKDSNGQNENRSKISGRNSEMGTRSQRNKLNTNSGRIKAIVKNKIYDSDEQVVSLGEEQPWQSQTPNLFYKDPNTQTQAQTNTNRSGHQMEDEQSDILSDYIPQQPSSPLNKGQKISQENLLKKNMQSIEEVQDQLFEKLKSQDNRNRNSPQKVKRTDFQFSGKPNPLVQYAKTIDFKKMQQQAKQVRDRRRDRYGRK